MHAKWARTAAAGVAVLTLATACGGSTKPSALRTPSQSATDPSSSSATSDPTPSWSPTQQAIITAYQNFWTALPQASRAASSDDRLRLLFPYTTDPALSQIFSTIETQRSQGKVLYGVHTARVQSVSASGETAKLFDCQDASGAGIARASDNSRLTVGVARNPVNATLLLKSGHWKVSVIDYPQGASC